MIAAIGVLAGVPATAVAVFGGIINYSGRNGTTCSECHRGGREPDVEFEAPQGTQMSAGAIATFRFRIKSNRRAQQTHAGFGVAASGGTLRVTDPVGTRVPFPDLPEMTHTMPRANSGSGVAVFEFEWQAPATPGTYTLFGAGNSVKVDGNPTGEDATTATTLDIDVLAGPGETATVTPTPTPIDTPAVIPSATASSTPSASAAPTFTATAQPTTSPTATTSASPGGACTGDCDGSDAVTVDEIVRGVVIALGNRPVEDCLAFDRNRDGVVTVDEIVDAIGNALNGCG